MEDLQQLEQARSNVTQQSQRAQALEQAAALRERIRRWQAEHGITSTDAVAALQQLREERDDDILATSCL